MSKKTLSAEEITVHVDNSSLEASTEEKLLAEESAEDENPVEVDILQLKDELGIPSILSSVEEIKALVHEVVGKRKTTSHSEQNSAKKTRSEEAFEPRVGNSEFDPTESVEVEVPPEDEDTLFSAVFDDSETSGPKISEKLASRVNEACTKKAIETKMKELEAKYHTPENCTNLCVPKVNPELWHDLQRSSKTKDLALQEVQRGIVKATQPILSVLEEAIAAQKRKENIEPNTIMTKLADSVTFLCHASYKTSMTRRETLKDVINTNYRSVCGQNTPLGKCLFGDELPLHIKNIAEVNKLSKKISSSQQASSSSGKRDKDSFKGHSSNKGKRSYFLSYGGNRHRPRNRKESYQTNKSSSTTTK